MVAKKICLQDNETNSWPLVRRRLCRDNTVKRNPKMMQLPPRTCASLGLRMQGAERPACYACIACSSTILSHKITKGLLLKKQSSLHPNIDCSFEAHEC